VNHRVNGLSSINHLQGRRNSPRQPERDCCVVDLTADCHLILQHLPAHTSLKREGDVFASLAETLSPHKSREEEEEEFHHSSHIRRLNDLYTR
jgi:hypothetical protein